MKNDSLTTHQRNGFRDRLAAFVHRMTCADCRRSRSEWSRLSRGVERLEDDTLPPSLDEKLLADAMKASAEARSQHASPSRSRASEALAMRRVRYAVGFAVILLVAGGFLFPRMQGNSAVAGVLRALANVKSCHIIGWTFDKDGRKVDIEGWFKAPDRMRMRHGESYDYLVKDDRSTTVWDGVATIEAVEDTGGVDGIMALLSAESLKGMAAGHGMKMDVDNATLPDGRAALVLTMHEQQEKYTGTVVFTVDKENDLLVSMQEYDRNHKLTCEISKIEYDVAVPDSAFDLELAEGTVVADLVTPPTAEQLKWRQKEKQRLIQANAEVAISIPKGVDQIRGYQFDCLKTGGLLVFYIPDRGIYRVLGAARVTGPNGFEQIVEDGDIRLPEPPSGIPLPPPALETKQHP